MSKKIISLTVEQSAVLRSAVCEGPGWADPPGKPAKNQWRQMNLVDAIEAAGAGAIELETTSADRRAIIAALEDGRVVGAIKGRGVRFVWGTKLAFGWKAPDLADLEEDDE